MVICAVHVIGQCWDKSDCSLQKSSKNKTKVDTTLTSILLLQTCPFCWHCVLTKKDKHFVSLNSQKSCELQRSSVPLQARELLQSGRIGNKEQKPPQWRAQNGPIPVITVVRSSAALIVGDVYTAGRPDSEKLLILKGREILKKKSSSNKNRRKSKTPYN